MHNLELFLPSLSTSWMLESCAQYNQLSAAMVFSAAPKSNIPDQNDVNQVWCLSSISPPSWRSRLYLDNTRFNAIPLIIMANISCFPGQLHHWLLAVAMLRSFHNSCHVAPNASPALGITAFGNWLKRAGGFSGDENRETTLGYKVGDLGANREIYSSLKSSTLISSLARNSPVHQNWYLHKDKQYPSSIIPLS